MKLSNTIWFWILQLIGWGAIAAFNTLFKLINAKNLEKNYIIAEGLLFLIVAVFWSTLFRLYIKKHVTFQHLNLLETLKIIGSFLVTVILLSLSLLFFASVLYSAFYKIDLQLSMGMIISNILFSFIYMLFWLISYRIIKMSVQFRKDKEKRLTLEATLKASELNILKGQINPHFMFNSLNNIRGLMLEDVEQSREMITRLSEMLRYALTKNKVNTIALKDELEMVDNYIELSKIQFENRLQFSSTIDKGLLTMEIPPMIIQMLIENAIKHGISNLVDGGSIALNISESNNILKIVVCNSGTLAKDSSSTKVGLENIKKRLYLLYKNQASFTLKAEEKTVIATIKLPI